MDQNDAIKLSRNYVDRVRLNHIEVVDAWLFGSYAKGTYHDDSDIDLALVLPDNSVSFNTDVTLMAMRKGDETIIETHTFSRRDFSADTPVVRQIKQFGFRLM
jgi:predicted nucleotidyltransferase